MKRPSGVAVMVAAIALGTACGGGSDDPGAASVLATRLLGAEETDDTRDDHRCVEQALAEEFSADTLSTLAAVDDLEELDVPSRQRLLQAALRCVSAVDVGT